VPDDARSLVVVARMEGAVAGVAEGWTAGPVAELVSVTTVAVGDDPPAPPLDLGVDAHLRSAWASAAADRGASPR
jgi:hypothetical protein